MIFTHVIPATKRSSKIFEMNRCSAVFEHHIAYKPASTTASLQKCKMTRSARLYNYLEVHICYV